MPIKGIILILLVAIVFAIFYSDIIYKVIVKWWRRNKR